MNFRQRPPARPTGQEQRKKENRAYYTVIGVSLALIVILTIMLILKLGKKKPVATETEAEESLDFTLEEVLPEDDPLDSETILHVETVAEPLPEETTEAEEGPVIVTNPEQVTVAPAATTNKAKDTEPTQTSAESTTVVIPILLSRHLRMHYSLSVYRLALVGSAQKRRAMSMTRHPMRCMPALTPALCSILRRILTNLLTAIKSKA